MQITDRNKFKCEIYPQTKISQSRNRLPDTRVTKILEMVHVDLVGPIDPIAKDGFKYLLGCIDNYSSLIVTYTLKNKSDVLKVFKKFMADSSTNGNSKYVRTNQGTEFTSVAFNSVLIKNKINHQKTSPYSTHQNGTIERAWRTILEMARCILKEANLHKYMWSYAIMSSTYIRNRCYNNRIGTTPYEIFTGRKPNLLNRHLFGSICYAYVQNPKK